MFVVSLLSGALVTLELAAAAAVITTIVAPVAAIGRLSRYRLPRFVAGVYIEVFRGTSAIVQLLFAYYVLPLFGISLPAFETGAVVLGLNLGSYGAEIVRGAMQAVPAEQHSAGAVLGMGKLLTLRRVIIPQALLSMVPPWTNLMIDLMKTTAFVSLIGITDLTFQAQIVMTTTGGGYLVGVVLFAMALYILMAQVIAVLGRSVERRLSRGRDVGRQATRLTA